MRAHTRRRRAAFTLLELLVATTLLIGLVALLANMLNHTGDLWSLGTNRVRLLTQARATLGFVAADAENAFQTNLTVLADESGTYATFGSTNACVRLYRVATRPRPDCLPWEVVDYTVSNRADGVSVLLRTVRRPLPDPAGITPQPLPGEYRETFDGFEVLVTQAVVLEGVVAVYFLPWSVPTPDTAGDRLPEALDVYLEVLAPAHCRRARGLPAVAQERYVADHAVRIAGRYSLLTHSGWRPL